MPIQTSLSVAPKLTVSLRLGEKCENLRKTSTPLDMYTVEEEHAIQNNLFVKLVSIQKYIPINSIKKSPVKMVEILMDLKWNYGSENIRPL